MALDLTTLEDELKAMALHSTEAAAVTAWADAFAAYFEGDGVTKGAVSNLIYVSALAMPAAKAAMEAALVGMLTTGATLQPALQTP